MPHQSPITSHESPFASAQGKPITDVRSALRDAIAQLEREHVPSAPLAAELLLMHTLGHDRAWLYAHPEEELDAGAREQYFSLIARRASGVPTQYLTGHQEFWGLDFEVTPDVLIPRPETEHVIEVALERLGVGLGRRALRVAKQNFASRMWAPALAASPSRWRTNCPLRASLPQTFPPPLSKWRAAMPRATASPRASISSNATYWMRFSTSHQPPVTKSRFFDLIASNPPYIGRREAATLPREVREHEPESALFGGETGTEIYAPLIAQAAMLLKPSGILVLELGHKSAEHVSRLLDAPEWTCVALTNDLAGISRVASALRNSN